MISEQRSDAKSMRNFRFKIDLEHLSSKSRIGLGKRFVDHLEGFMDDAGLFPLNSRGKAFVAVSGGLDSMCLLIGLFLLHKKGRLSELKVLHVNHGSREENALEEKLVTETCEILGLDCFVKKLSMNASGGNFEAKARSERYKFFNEHAVGTYDKVYLAHHIDDSFEWSLLQGLKSSSLTPTLGIPVFRGKFTRPFMCLSKKHIRRMGKIFKIPFLHDKSNDNNDFERNFLRNNIIPTLRDQHPGYLKHYVYRANDMARLLSKSVLFEDHSENIVDFKDEIGGVGLINWDFKNEFFIKEMQMIDLIKSISLSGRGDLRGEVSKMCRAQAAGKLGPMPLSGQVFGHMAPSLVYFSNAEFEEKRKEIDRELSESMSKMKHGQHVFKLSDLESHLQSKMTGQYPGTLGGLFPFFVASYEKDKMEELLPGMKRPHHLWPKLTAAFLERGIWFHYSIQLVKVWRKTHKALKMDAKIIF